MTPTAHATGEEILQELVRNLEQSLEPLLYTVLAPSVFDVYLHPDDLDRLSGIIPQLLAEARRALDERLEALQQEAQPSRLRRLLPGQPGKVKEFKSVAGGWYISFHENADPDVSPGDILVDSRLTLPPAPELGAGSRTRRISTLRSAGTSRLVASAIVDEASPSGPTRLVHHPERAALLAADALAGAPTGTSAAPRAPASDAPTDKVAPARGARARLRYQDQSGVHTYLMEQPEIVVGRGGSGYWVDVRLEALPDVSRTHFKIRRDDAGQFFIKDVSAYGTTLNGVRLPSSIRQAGDRKLDLERETPLPASARIGLADILFIDFEVLPS